MFRSAPATIGLEIVDQLPAVDVIYVPMGDTALIRGVASAVKQRRPSIRIVGVVAERAPAYLLSWQKVVQAFGLGPSAGETLTVQQLTSATMSSRRRRATRSPTASRSGARWPPTSPRFASSSTMWSRSASRR